ncbi:MAG: nuclear transport factor 2 family protein [SAR86 cluster bacterium]|jgi:uncharacterized protein
MSNIELIEKVYETFSAGDMAAWAVLHTADFEYKNPGNFPHSGTFVGPQVVIDKSFSVMAETISNLEILPIKYFDCGDTVFVHLHMNGDNLQSETMHRFTVRDGLISKFQCFDDTAAIWQAAAK